MADRDNRIWDNELFRNILLVALTVGTYYIANELLPDPDLTPPSPHPDVKVNMTFKPSREHGVIVTYVDFLPSEGLPLSTIEDNVAFYYHAQPSQGITSQAKYLVVFIADEAWRKGIDAAVKSLSENFDILLIHHQYVPGYWEGLEWSNQVNRMVISKESDWFMMSALHSESLPAYEYVVIWRKDLKAEDFDAEEYIESMKKHHIEISHPGLELDKMQTPMKSKKEFNCEASISTMSTAFSRDAWLCLWDMVLTDKIPRPDDEKPAQRIMPDADEVDQSDISLDNKEWCSKEWKMFCDRMAELEASYFDKSDSPEQHSDEL